MKFEIYEPKTSVKDLFERVQIEATESEKLDVKPYSYWKSVASLFFKKPVAIFSFVVILVIISLSIIVPLMNPDFDFFSLDYSLALKSPFWPFNFAESDLWGVALWSEASFWDKLSWSLSHPFGLSATGVDMWNLVWFGTQLSLKLAVTVSAINITLGIVIGSIWGYFRKLDPIFIEIRNFIQNVPQMLLYMLLIYVMRPSFTTLVFVMTVFGWMGLANFIRNYIIVINNREYNIASKTLGTSPMRMITHNLLPYLVSVIVTVVARMIPGVITAEVGLTYFGLGFNVGEEVTLGSVMQLGYQSFMNFPHVLFFPALIASLLSLSFFLLGLNLADATDPKNHR